MPGLRLEWLGMPAGMWWWCWGRAGGRGGGFLEALWCAHVCCILHAGRHGTGLHGTAAAALVEPVAAGTLGLSQQQVTRLC
jgi:hypothetical protein